MRELWGSKVPRRCGKTENHSDIVIWIICGIIGAAILAMR